MPEISPSSATNPSTNLTQVPVVSKETIAAPKEIIPQALDKQQQRPPPVHLQQPLIQQQPPQQPQQARRDSKDLSPKVLERQDSSGSGSGPAAAHDGE